MSTGLGSGPAKNRTSGGSYRTDTDCPRSSWTGMTTASPSRTSQLVDSPGTPIITGFPSSRGQPGGVRAAGELVMRVVFRSSSAYWTKSTAPASSTRSRSFARSIFTSDATTSTVPLKIPINAASSGRSGSLGTRSVTSPDPARIGVANSRISGTSQWTANPRRERMRRR